MKTRLIFPYAKFYEAVRYSTRLEDADLKYRYKMSARCCAFWYRNQNFDLQLDGPQDIWWQNWISALEPKEAKDEESRLWKRVKNIRRDNIEKLKEGSALHFAAVVHQALHATPDLRAQKFAKHLDYRAFGEPSEEKFGKICEFIEETDLHSAEVLHEENKGRSLVEVSGLSWTQMPTNSSDRELSMDLTFDVFEQEIGGRYYAYGTTQARFQILPVNFDVKKFYQSSRRELPEYITDNNQGRYTARGPKDDFGLLNGNAISDVICIVAPKAGAEAIVQIEAEVMRYHLDVKSINTATNRAEEESEEERINLINKLICVLLNKRSLNAMKREIQICQASIHQ
ncbi:hypothetical protein [Roseobacter sp.]|uniref:hypothetical protein n=1 Tax=Roseobacter sp. TaxID=1907202 RepID=UPI00329965D6